MRDILAALGIKPAQNRSDTPRPFIPPGLYRTVPQASPTDCGARYAALLIPRTVSSPAFARDSARQPRLVSRSPALTTAGRLAFTRTSGSFGPLGRAMHSTGRSDVEPFSPMFSRAALLGAHQRSPISEDVFARGFPQRAERARKPDVVQKTPEASFVPTGERRSLERRKKMVLGPGVENPCPC